MKRRLSGMAGALAALAVAGGLLAAPAQAQTPNPAPVKNVDEKGRSPYMENQTLVCNQGLVCELSFPPVPAGKRLVVQHVNAGIGIPTGGVRLTALATQGNTQFLLPARSISESTLLIVNEPVLGYFESGQAPIFRVVLTATADVAFVSSTISGYLIDFEK